jgi:hypothetical protein
MDQVNRGFRADPAAPGGAPIPEKPARPEVYANGGTPYHTHP